MLNYSDITAEMAEMISVSPCAFTSETLVLVWKFLSESDGESTATKTAIANVLASRHHKQLMLDTERARVPYYPFKS